MTCTFPRNDPRRPVCGRTATVIYVGPGVRYPRCDGHDTYAARMAAPDFGLTRRPVMSWAVV